MSLTGSEDSSSLRDRVGDGVAVHVAATKPERSDRPDVWKVLDLQRPCGIPLPFLGISNAAADIPLRYNIAPMQFSSVLLMEDGERVMRTVRWGLVPSWAKDPTIGNRMINARAETLAEKPSFREAFRRRRCCVIADGFYEWFQPPGEKAKIPIRFVMKDRRPFLLAGLWERWQPPDAENLQTFTIVTAEPNELLARFHHRMAVILPHDKIDEWMDPQNTSTEPLAKLLVPFPADEMEAYPVSTEVNSPRNDTPEVIQAQGDLFG